PDPLRVHVSTGASARRGSAAHVFVDDLTVPELGPEDHHHLGTVLRLRRGEQVSVSDGAGAWREARWTGAGIEWSGEPAVEDPPDPLVTVGFAPAKGDRPERVTRMLTELGVDVIVPLSASRSVV